MSEENSKEVLMDYYTVSIDGPDKMGKSTIVQYIARLSGFILNILDRGPITNIVWNKMQGRNICYDLDMWSKTVFVYLTADKEDWETRCKMHNEPKIDYEMHVKMYKETAEEFRKRGFIVLEFNTSEMTQYHIAKEILKKLAELNSVESQMKSFSAK